MASLWKQFSLLILIGWAIALVRLGLDAAAKDVSMYFGVYYGMPIALIVLGLMGKFKGIPWRRLALGMILTGVLVWGLPNFISYTTAQFAGWDHGRFGEGRGPEIAETAAGKILRGATIGLITSLVGAVYMIVLGTLFIWLPNKILGRGKAETPTEDS